MCICVCVGLMVSFTLPLSFAFSLCGSFLSSFFSVSYTHSLPPAYPASLISSHPPSLSTHSHLSSLSSFHLSSLSPSHHSSISPSLLPTFPPTSHSPYFLPSLPASLPASLQALWDRNQPRPAFEIQPASLAPRPPDAGGDPPRPCLSLAKRSSDWSATCSLQMEGQASEGDEEGPGMCALARPPTPTRSRHLNYAAGPRGRHRNTRPFVWHSVRHSVWHANLANVSGAQERVARGDGPLVPPVRLGFLTL